jgi:hypothetical protein
VFVKQGVSVLVCSVTHLKLSCPELRVHSIRLHNCSQNNISFTLNMKEILLKCYVTASLSVAFDYATAPDTALAPTPTLFLLLLQLPLVKSR